MEHVDFWRVECCFTTCFQYIFFSKAEPWWFRKWNATMNEWITLSFSQSIIKSGKKVETRDHRLEQLMTEWACTVHDTSRGSNTWFDPQIKWHELVGSSVGCSRWYFHKIWPIWCTYRVRNKSYRIHRTGGRPFFSHDKQYVGLVPRSLMWDGTFLGQLWAEPGKVYCFSSLYKYVCIISVICN
jgi:hypothetical protein